MGNILSDISENIYIIVFIVLFLVLLVAFSVLKNDKDIKSIEEKVGEEPKE